MKHFYITLISGNLRIIRNVIAESSMKAVQIGISMMPDTTAPLAIICKVRE